MARKRKTRVRPHQRRIRGVPVSVREHERFLEARRKWALKTPLEKQMVRLERANRFFKLRGAVIGSRVAAAQAVEDLRRARLINLEKYQQLKRGVASGNVRTSERSRKEVLDTLTNLEDAQSFKIADRLDRVVKLAPKVKLKDRKERSASERLAEIKLQEKLSGKEEPVKDEEPEPVEDKKDTKPPKEEEGPKVIQDEKETQKIVADGAEEAVEIVDKAVKGS